MEGVGHGDLPRFYAQVLEHLHGLFHGFGLAGYHGLQRAVLVGADDIALYLFKFYFHFVAAPGYGGHLAGVRHLHVGHFLGAAGHGFQAVLEGEDAGRGGGGVFAKGVAYGHVGLYAEFFEQAVHRYVRGHHGRLGQLGLLYGGLAPGQFFLALAGLAPDGFGEADADHLLEDHVGLVEGLLHHLVLGGEVTHHVHVLRALAGEQQAHLGLVGPGLESVNALQLEVEREFGPGLGLGVLDHELHFVRQVLGRLGHDGNAVSGFGLEHGRLRVNGHRVDVGPLGERGCGGFLSLLQHVGRCIAGKGDGFALYGGERRAGILHNFNRGARGFCFGRGLGGTLVVGAGVLFHGHVEVSAAETERGNVGTADAVLLPGFRFIYDLEEVQVYARVGLLEIYRGGQRLVVDGERRFSDAHRAGRGLGVADLGFHRSKAELLPVAHVGPEHFLEYLHFRGVPHLGGGAVRFHEVHVGRGIVHPGEGVLYGDLLALGVGGGYAFALAVRRGAHGVYQRVNFIAVPHRVGEPFQDINGHRFRHHEAVGPFIEGIGPFRGQRADLAELHEGRRAHHLVRAAGYRHVELARAQAQHRVVERRQGGGAGRVHGHVGAVQVENVGYSAGSNVGQLAGHGVLGYLDDPVVYAFFEFFDHRVPLLLRQGGESCGMFKDIFVVELVHAQVGHFLAHRAHRVAYYGGGHFGVEGFLVVAGIFQRHAHGLYGHLLQAGDLVGGLRGYLVPDRIEFKAFNKAAYLGIGLIRGLVIF